MSTPLEFFTPMQALGAHTMLVRAADGTPRVLKRLAEAQAADPAARLRFWLEAWRASQLAHPRFARASLVSAEGETPTYAMPYAQGPAATLVAPSDAGAAVREVASALLWLHRRGWVHAGLDPTALRRTEAGLVLVRYGRLTPIGRSAPEAPASPYTAPEQRDGLPLDGRADLYALGALLRLWLTGASDPTAAASALESSPHDLAPIARRLLADAPSERFRDAAELLVALDVPVPDGVGPRLAAPPVPRPALEAPLGEWLDGLAQGVGGARALGAPAGAGKTTMLEAAERLARARGLSVVRLGAGDAADVPLSPFSALTGQLWRLAAQRSASVVAGLRARLGALDVLKEPDPLMRAVAPDTGLQRYAHTLGELVAAVAPPGLLVCVDDWDQADEASRAVLAELVRRTAALPLGWLVAGEGEPGFAAPRWTFPPLTRDEALALVAAHLEGPLPAQDLLALIEHAQGQPWHLATLTRQLLEAGALRPNGTPLDPAAWPSDATGLAWWRLQGLSDAAWTVGGLVATLAPLARAVDMGTLLERAPEVLAEGLDTLLGLGVLEEAASGFRFGHPCYQGLFASAYPPPQQRAFYGQLLARAEAQDEAPAFAGPGASDLVSALDAPSWRPEPVRRVLWALRAEQPEAIVRYAAAAAEAMLARGATQTARMLIEEGLASAGADDGARHAYMAALATVLRRSGDPAGACEVYASLQAEWAAESLPLGLLLAWAAAAAERGAGRDAVLRWREAVEAARRSDDASAEAVGTAGLAAALAALGERSESLALAETAVGAARDAAPWPKARALATLGTLLVESASADRHTEGIALLERAATLFEAESDAHGQLDALLRLAAAAFERGTPLASRASAERAAALASALAAPAAALEAAQWRCESALELNDGPAARQLAQHLRELSSAPARAAEALALDARAHLLTGDENDAWLLANQAREALGSLAPGEAGHGPALDGARLRVGLALAETALATGHPGEALAALAGLQESAERTPNGERRARRRYWLGRWAAATGDRARARADFKAVLAEPNQWLIIRATLELGRLASEAGAQLEAAGWFEQARRAAAALGAEPLLAETSAAERGLRLRPLSAAGADAAQPNASERLAALLAEAQALLPQLGAAKPAASPDEALAKALRASERENALLRAFLGARDALEVALILARAALDASQAERACVFDARGAVLVALARDGSPCAADASTGPLVARALGGETTAVGPGWASPLRDASGLRGVLHLLGAAPEGQAAAQPLTDLAALALARYAP